MSHGDPHVSSHVNLKSCKLVHIKVPKPVCVCVSGAVTWWPGCGPAMRQKGDAGGGDGFASRREELSFSRLILDFGLN